VEHLEGRTYGPYPYRLCQEKVREFVAVTGDPADRWADQAPPGIAGALLFVVAPHLLSDPDAGEHTRSVIHGEQRFTWLADFPVEADCAVSGTVGRVRERAGLFFVGFELEVSGPDGPLLNGSSSFLMSGAAPPAGDSLEEDEPAVDESGPNDPWAEGATFADLRRSASRADLVRYAAATRDWNPIHWDHVAARRAGLPGVVVHGLLQVAWAVSAATRLGGRPAEGRFRFRSPLRPAVPALLRGAAEDAMLRADLIAGDNVVMSAEMTMA
jgi:hypothetical protein